MLALESLTSTWARACSSGRIADLRLKLGEIGLGASDTITGGGNFVRAGGAALLEPFERGKLALRRIELGGGLLQIGLAEEDLLLVASGQQIAYMSPARLSAGSARWRGRCVRGCHRAQGATGQLLRDRLP